MHSERIHYNQFPLDLSLFVFPAFQIPVHFYHLSNVHIQIMQQQPDSKYSRVDLDNSISFKSIELKNPWQNSCANELHSQAIFKNRYTLMASI